MLPQPSALWRCAQIRAIDAFAIGALAVPGFELMQRAAHAAWIELRRSWPQACHVVVICGGGNNAGDGYLLAHLARAAGLEVRVGATTDASRLRGAAARACAQWCAGGGVVLPWRAALSDPTHVVVDALLGIGIEGVLRSDVAAAAAAINALSAPVLSLDVPSGLCADSGRCFGAGVRADVTVTFIANKPGLWLGRGPDLAGQVVVADLALRDWPDGLGDAAHQPLAPADLRPLQRRRSRGANKGQFGHVLVIGGGAGMPGAALLCAHSALRSGAGLVSVATAPEHAAALAASRPELMVSAVATPSELMPLLNRASVLAMGPGLGQSAWARSIWSCAMASGKPMVVDADALNLLASQPEQRDAWVLTPHPGEAGRLLGIDAAAVQADRVAAVTALRARYGGCVVLKGAGTLIGCDDAPARICLHGNPGMAAPGMGDVLSGVIAALQAQLTDLALAARLGVYVHALAGDRAARGGERGMLASDLIAELRACVNV